MAIQQSAPVNDSTTTPASVPTPLRDSVDAQYGLKPFIATPPIKEKVEYAELEAIDFSKYSDGTDAESLAARKQLAQQLDRSVSTYGFFYITNPGIPIETIDRLNSIIQRLNATPEDEKLEYRSGGMVSDEDTTTVGAERGGGYKPRKYWGMANGVRDNIEFYNFVDLVQDESLANEHHPEVIRAYLNEIGNFFRYIHHSVLRRLCTLCDVILELPEGTFWSRYFKVVQRDLNNSGGGLGRLMTYYGHTEEENRRTNNTWLRGHSDSGAFTFIVSQPMVTLQILNYATHSWQYVKHVPGALVVNIGDAIEFLTGGYFRSTIHRVINPFPSQSGYTRQSLIYFCKPANSTIIDPDALDSPYLKRLNITKPPSWKRIRFSDWDREKGRLFGKRKINDLDGDAPAPAIIHGRYAERWIPSITHQEIVG